MSGRATATESVPATGVRATRQRHAIASLLNTVDEFRSAQELHDTLKSEGESIGLTTVYRNLQALADAGEIDVLRTDSGESRYRRCSAGHHHHLVCRDCGTTIEVQADPVEDWAAAVASGHGYTDVSHTVEIFGRCPDCHA